MRLIMELSKSLLATPEYLRYFSGFTVLPLIIQNNSLSLNYLLDYKIIM